MIVLPLKSCLAINTDVQNPLDQREKQVKRQDSDITQTLGSGLCTASSQLGNLGRRTSPLYISIPLSVEGKDVKIDFIV